MTRRSFGSALHTVFARRLGFLPAAAVSTMPAMPSVAKRMHRDHPGKKQYPNPVLVKPLHDCSSIESIWLAPAHARLAFNVAFDIDIGQHAEALILQGLGIFCDSGMDRSFSLVPNRGTS